MKNRDNIRLPQGTRTPRGPRQITMAEEVRRAAAFRVSRKNVQFVSSQSAAAARFMAVLAAIFALAV